MKCMNGLQITPAKYAQGMMAVHCPPDGSGFKTRASRLASAFCKRYSHRERAYIMGKAKAERLTRLYLEGWDAGALGDLIPPASNN